MATNGPSAAEASRVALVVAAARKRAQEDARVGALAGGLLGFFLGKSLGDIAFPGAKTLLGTTAPRVLGKGFLRTTPGGLLGVLGAIGASAGLSLLAAPRIADEMYDVIESSGGRPQ